MDVFDMLGSSLAEAVRFFGIDRRRYEGSTFHDDAAPCEIFCSSF